MSYRRRRLGRYWRRRRERRDAPVAALVHSRLELRIPALRDAGRPYREAAARLPA